MPSPHKQKKTLLLFNLAVDARDPLLGFTVPLIARIACEMESVHVITVRTGTFSLPPNVFVYSVGRERGVGKIACVHAFYRHLFFILRGTRIDACFSHMNPLFTVLASPMLFVRRIPIILWYSHRYRGFIVRIAHFFSSRIVTSISEAYTSSDPKIIITGHMVDTDFFTPLSREIRMPPFFLSMGRISPIKDLVTFIRAAAILRDKGYAFICSCVGPVSDCDGGYNAFLRAEIKRLSLQDFFSFVSAVAYEDTPSYYRSALVHVNLCATGSLDKATLEAMACGTVSVFANTAYIPLVGAFSSNLFFRHADPRDLARIMAGLMDASPQTLCAIRTSLRERIVAYHSMDSFIVQLCRIVEEL